MVCISPAQQLHNICDFQNIVWPCQFLLLRYLDCSSSRQTAAVIVPRFLNTIYKGVQPESVDSIKRISISKLLATVKA